MFLNMESPFCTVPDLVIVSILEISSTVLIHALGAECYLMTRVTSRKRQQTAPVPLAAGLIEAGGR